MRDSAILNAKPFGVAEGNCPDVMSLEDSHVTVTSMPRKKVAGVGSAPTSADFQPAAHLSEPSSVWKVVPRRGDAPRSFGYQPNALLLSYGGMGSVVQPSRLWLQTQSRELHHTNETGSSGWVACGHAKWLRFL